MEIWYDSSLEIRSVINFQASFAWISISIVSYFLFLFSLSVLGLCLGAVGNCTYESIFSLCKKPDWIVIQIYCMWESSDRLVLFPSQQICQLYILIKEPDRSVQTGSWCFPSMFDITLHIYCVYLLTFWLCVFSLSETFVSFHPMKYSLHLVRCTCG